MDLRHANLAAEALGRECPRHPRFPVADVETAQGQCVLSICQVPERTGVAGAEEMKENALRLHLNRHHCSVDAAVSASAVHEVGLCPTIGRRPVKSLKKLSWRVRGGGGTCSVEVDQPIHGFRVKPKYLPNRLGDAGSEGPAPTVSGISFDGHVYWVRLSTAPGWPRSIRVTQADVDGATP